MRVRRFVGQGSIACIAAAAVVVAASEPRSAEKPAASRLSAEQIVAKSVAARGGLDAWRKVETMMWTGHIQSVHAAVPIMMFEMIQKRPNKMHFEINAMGERTVRVFDGRQGWKARGGHGGPNVQPYSPEELQFARGGQGIDGPLIDYSAKGSSVSVAGIDQVEKRDAYHLVVRTAAGATEHVWVDTKTFLEVRYDRSASGPSGGSRTVSVVYRDYKTTDGLKIPSVIETGVGAGVVPDKMLIETVVVNPPVDEQAFVKPGQGRMQAGARGSHGGAAPGGFPPMRATPTPLPQAAPPADPAGAPAQDPSSPPSH